MSQASDALKICLIRIKCGKSFTQAIEDLAFPIEEQRVRQFARELFQKILAQSLPALNGIEALREHLLLIEGSKKLLQTKTFLPKMQSKILGILGTLLVVACFFLLPSELKPDLRFASISLGMIALALWISFKLSQALEKHFWFSAWIQILSLWKTQLACGHTLLSAYRETSSLISDLPPGIRSQCGSLFKALASGQQLTPPPSESHKTNKRRRPPFHREAEEQLKLIVEQAVRGEPVSELLEDFNKENQTQFTLFISEESERTQLKMMLPLLGLFLPAFWVIVFGPLLSHLVQASK